MVLRPVNVYQERNMKRTIVAIAVILTATSSFAADVTFESIQKEFQQKAISLLSDQDASADQLHSKLAKFADDTFGAHPDVMRKEA